MKLNLEHLTDLIDQLMGPKGCPWGKEQTPEAFIQYVIEESYEVLDALHHKDSHKIQEELGDVLFAYLCTLKVACQKYHVHPEPMLKAICDKVIRRHPHVFENPRPITFEELRVQWEQIKAQERALQGKVTKEDLFASIAQSMPAVIRAMKLVELGVSKGFQYPADESTLEGRFMKLVIDGLNQFENLEKVCENALRDYKNQFQQFLEMSDTKIVSE